MQPIGFDLLVWWLEKIPEHSPNGALMFNGDESHAIESVSKWFHLPNIDFQVRKCEFHGRCKCKWSIFAGWQFIWKSHSIHTWYIYHTHQLNAGKHTITWMVWELITYLKPLPHTIDPIPGDSKWPLYPLVEGHLAFERVTFSPSQKGHQQNRQVPFEFFYYQWITMSVDEASFLPKPLSVAWHTKVLPNRTPRPTIFSMDGNGDFQPFSI